MVPVLFAPMEGLTDAVYRRVHRECFGGIDAYFIPFISPTKNLELTVREKRNVLPSVNTGVPCVPQVLTKDAEHFLWASELLADMGYTEINLNAGCPSGTVTAKGKGAGMLKDPDALDRFLETVCARSPLPVSVKTRIGFDTPEEWPALLSVYARYPLRRLIVHPRTCRERYEPGKIHPECFQAARESYPGALVFNGDLFSAAQAEDRLKESPGIAGLMLGRGLIANPALARELSGGAGLKKEELVRFHDHLTRTLSGEYPAWTVFNKLRIVMKYMACAFEHAGKLQKKIHKSNSLSELLEIDQRLFDTCELKNPPVFEPGDLLSPKA